MKHTRSLFVMLLMSSFIYTLPCKADLFALELDGQIGYSRIGAIEHPDSRDNTTLSGLAAGVRGKVEVLFISMVVDYQHLFSNADFLHAGLGWDFKLPTPFIEPFVGGSAGLMMLSAKKKHLIQMPPTI